MGSLPNQTLNMPAASPPPFHRTKNGRAQSPLHCRDPDRNLRLFKGPLRPCRHPALPCQRRARHAPKPRKDYQIGPKFAAGDKTDDFGPLCAGKKAEFREDFQDMVRKGYMRMRVDGTIVNLTDEVTLDGNVAHDVDVVIDRLTVEPQSQSRIADSITQALLLGQGSQHPRCGKRRRTALFHACLLRRLGALLFLPRTA